VNYTRTSTIGIDTVVQSIQNDIYNNLVSEWGDSIDGYGRVYKNINSDGEVIPELYIGKGDYKPIYHNDNKAATFFFVEGDLHTTEDEFLYITESKFVFMVNLEKAFSDTDRSDEKAHRDVLEFMRETAYERFTITGIEKGVKRVLNEFETKGIKFQDIHPYHCFSVNVTLSYYLTDKCN
jgi:hypothetical protein